MCCAKTTFATVIFLMQSFEIPTIGKKAGHMIKDRKRSKLEIRKVMLVVSEIEDSR